MSTILYNCKRCKVGRRVDYNAGRDSNGYRSWPYRIDERGSRQFPSAYIMASGGGKPTGYGGDPLGLCPACGKPMTYGAVIGIHNDSVPCDTRCTGARGHICECSCGGKNHGSQWA